MTEKAEGGGGRGEGGGGRGEGGGGRGLIKGNMATTSVCFARMAYVL